jgi:ABC-type sugar transport system ATPase subunit
MAGRLRLEVRDLVVAYGAHQVVHGISFGVGAGSAVALLGANGSGKSTTVKALTGVNRPGEGSQVLLNGTVLRTRDLTPGETRRLGIRVVHQEAPLIPGMTVAEMMALHLGFPVRAGLVRRRELRRTTRETLEEFDVRVRPDQLCGELTAGDRALVSLAVSMAGIPVESALLVLDEATASLTSHDADRLLRRVRNATERGLGVLMVTHRLSEVSAYCDKTLVLRDGHVARSFSRADFTAEAAVAAMVGQQDDGGHHHHPAPPPTAVPAGAELTVVDLAGRELRGATFGCAAGEVLGVTGRNGEGATELLRLVGGVVPCTGGRVEVDGARLAPGSPRSAILHGVYYLSADRLAEGGIPAMTVAENMVLPRVERYGLDRRGPARDVAAFMKKLSVRPDDPDVAFGSLSGGNQQKVLLSRWLLLSPKVLLLDDPTAGVDPATREIIFGRLKELAGQGVCVVLRSSEPEHLARLCSRVLVVQEGQIVDQLVGDEISVGEVSRATFA